MGDMITAAFNDGEEYKMVSGLWQWDYGQILRIQGLNLPTAVEVDFAVAGASESVARIGTTKDGVTDVVIPDSLIETGKNLVAYVYLRDSESGNTEYQIDMVMSKRAKPEAYDTPEDKELFGQAIEAVNTAADRAEKAEQDAIHAAEQAEVDAQKTAEDRKEVEKMVETVSDISEQVKKVEELSNKAQEAATKTGQDAQQTAEDRVEVGKMLENVRDISEQVKSVDESVRKAKESEQAAAQHRTAVEEMKNSVEQTASAFRQTVQSGIQSIENAGTVEVREIAQAGTAQKLAVETAGTKAAENVENVKASATEAVETAKTEAVQAVQSEGTTQTGNVTAEGVKQVKAVQDEGQKVLQSIPEDFPAQIATKLDKQQGVENKGKALVVGEDGNVVPGEVQGGDGISIINTMSSVSPLAIHDSAERPIKGFSIIGNTVQNQDPPPSPEYPQEIKSVGKLNEGTQKYEVDVTFNGSQLFKALEHSKGFYTPKDGKVSIVTTQGYSWKMNFSKWYGKKVVLRIVTTVNTRYRLYATDKEDNILYKYEDSSANTNNNYHTFEIPKNMNKLYISVLEINSEEQAEIMMNLGEVPLVYEPYKKPQTITLTSDRPITKWDKLIERDGQIGWLYGGKIIESYNSEQIDTEYISNTGKLSVGATVLYKLKETEFVQLQQTEQDAIRALKTYYPTTVVSVDGGEVVPSVELTYTADTKSYIDNKLKQLVTANHAYTANLLSLMPMETQAAMIENDTNNILESEVTQ